MDTSQALPPQVHIPHTAPTAATVPQAQRNARRKMTEMTPDKLETIKALWNREPSIPIKEIASMVGMSYNSVRAAIKKLAVCEEVGVAITDTIKKKGRKPKINEAAVQQVKEHLTSDRTASLTSAVQALNAAGVDVKKTSVRRMTLEAHVSYKSPKEVRRRPDPDCHPKEVCERHDRQRD